MYVGQAWGQGVRPSLSQGAGAWELVLGPWRVQRASRVSGRSGRTWQQLEALGLGT